MRRISYPMIVGMVMCLVAGYALGFFNGSHIIKETGTTGSTSTDSSIAAVASPTPTLDPHADFTYDNLLVRLNETRIAHGLPQLADDHFLSLAAETDLVGNCPITSHEGFRLQSDLGSFKGYSQTAETLASGSFTPEEAVEGLLSSPTHADIILNKKYGWTRVGIGVSVNGADCVSFIFSRK